MMLVPYSRKNHSVYNPFQDFDDLEKAFFSDRSLGELKTDIKGPWRELRAGGGSARLQEGRHSRRCEGQHPEHYRRTPFRV